MKRTHKGLLCLALGVCLLTGCAKAPETPVIRIIDSRISEGKIALRAAMLLIDAHTDATVELKDAMTAPNSFQELLADNADLFMSYDGTLLTTLLHVDPSEVPGDSSVYAYANQLAMEQHGCELLAKLGLNNTYVMAVPQEIAERYDLQVTSDLVPIAGELCFGAEHEFFDQEGSAKYGPYVEAYGLQFKESRSVDLNLKYAAVESGNIQATVVYATDGLNIKANLKTLKDDLNFFPEYNGAFLARSDLFEKMQTVAPELKEVLNRLEGCFTDESMANLTYQVDVEEKTPEAVAEAFLKEQGLLP